MNGMAGSTIVAATVFLVLSWISAMAAPAEDHWSSTPDDAAAVFVDEAQTYIKQRRFDLAVAVLREAADASPENADVWNLIGYSQRNRGNLKESSEAYAKALSLDPDHLGALEYQGELFLLTGDIASAEKNLKRLQVLCSDGCEEKDELSAAIKTYRERSQ